MDDDPYDWMIEDDEAIEPRCPCCDGRGIVSDDVDYRRARHDPLALSPPPVAGWGMPTYKDTVEVKDRPYNRAVKVTVTAPKLPARKRLEALAQQAWDARDKTMTVGQITVKVEAFKR